MKPLFRTLMLTASIVTACALTASAQNAPATPVTSGFSIIESVLHDPVADVYLVSNINGIPYVPDNDGFISRVAPDGRILNLKWIEGGKNGVTLNGPSGTAIVGNVLYVADLNVVRKFDRRTGRPLGDVNFPAPFTGANDLAAAPDGSVYVTDSALVPMPQPDGSYALTRTGTDAVYRVRPDGQVEVIAKEPALNGPNGVLVRKDGRVIIANEAGEVLELTGTDRKLLAQVGNGVIGPDGQVRSMMTVTGGLLDGLVETVDGQLYLSDFATGVVYRLDGSQPQPVAQNLYPLLPGLSAVSDIGYDAKRDRLLIPLFYGNRLVFQPVK